MTIQAYIDQLNTRYRAGNTTEHSFRADLQNLLESMLPDIMTTNEPTRVKCGAPDYVLTTRKDTIPVGYIEAKDIGADLNNKNYQEQFKRYREALNNLIITNYIDFQVYRDGEKVAEYSLAKLAGGTITPLPEQYAPFGTTLKDFTTPVGQTIKSPIKLAGMMAVKAKMLAQVIETALQSDEDNEENSTLKDQLRAFKDILIHDIKPNEFADIYAQTIAYGMFAARLHDPTLPTFSRQEAAELIPKTNPFLRKLFQYVAGYDLDKRIVWIVDALADIFRATDVRQMLQNFGKATRQDDPIIHFYETFLAEYDPKLRKARGVWYTPEPVVNFIVRAVDDILKAEFGLPDGLADTSKIAVKRTVETKATADMRSKLKKVEVEEKIHRVQILDPATGTGTFLAEVIKYVYSSKFEGQQGIWSNYVENHLIPRLNGFELLMASYAMAHLKLELLLTETGYRPIKDQRLKVYLTNSLEESHPDAGTLFANWLSSEANEANQIKRDTPVMVVIGNPPYSVSSTNKSKWIESLTMDFKKGLNERNIQPLSDDYIKFIRFGQHFIDKNGEGVLAYISNNSFIDGIIHRRMRSSLIQSFDKIYILDLHGSTKKNEVASDGGKDENIFDIQQGVSINLFIKRKTLNSKQIYHSDLYGLRKEKYSFLSTKNIQNVNWQEIKPEYPNFFFVHKNFKHEEKYNDGFPLNKLFEVYNTGIETGRDDFFVNFSQNELEQNVSQVLKSPQDESLKNKYKINDTTSFRFKEKVSTAKYQNKYLKTVLYRPFDIRYTYFDPELQRRASYQTMKNLIPKDNLALISCRQQSSFDFQHIFIADIITERCSISLQTKETGYVFPLYLCSENDIYNSENRTPNFQADIIARFSQDIGVMFAHEKEQSANIFAPIDVLDYIYAVLHSPAYRGQYKEFLKIDFPRVPYPKDAATFWALVAIGGQIRQLHLLEAPTVSKYITKYPIDGNNEVVKPTYKDGRVYINDTQYFDGVPQVAWEFYIGGYQPAQKWLKDRKERTLDFDDILHYQKMIVALTETDRLMKEIDKIDFM